MATTFWDIKSKVWTSLGQKSTSTTFSPTIVGDAINDCVLDFLRGKITSVLDSNRIYSAWRLWIREGTTYVRIAKDAVSTVQMTIWSNVLSCDTSNFSSSGWVEIGGEQLSYTGKTSTQLTGVSLNTVLHEAWDTVRQLYTMPSNFEKPIALKSIDETEWFDIMDIPFFTGNQFISYSIVKKSTASLIRIIGLDSNTLVAIKYSNVYTPMTANADICVIPDHYGTNVIALIVAWKLWFVKGIPNSQALLIEGYANLQNCYQYFDRDIGREVTKIMPNTYKNNSIRVWKITQ